MLEETEENGLREVLYRLEAGEIGVEEAAALLSAGRPTAAEADGEATETGRMPADGPPNRWRRFWVIPALAGGAVLLVGSLLMGLVYSAAAARGWLVCGWPLLIVGLVVLLLAVWSSWARWLHVRIREADGRRIAFSFPVPLALLSWLLQIASRFAPQLERMKAGEMIAALAQTRRGEPVWINVDEGDGGDQVELYLG